MKTISQKKSNFPDEKQVWFFFSYNRIWQTSSHFLLGCTRYNGNHCASYNFFSLTTKKLLKTNFWKNKFYSCSEKSISGSFVSYYRLWKTSKNNLKGSKKYCDSYLSSYKIFFRTYEVDEKMSQKKAIFQRKNNFGHIFLVLPNMADLR